MPVRAHPTLGAHQRPGQELHLIRETARVQQRRRAPDPGIEGMRGILGACAWPCFVSHAPHPQALASQSPSRHSSPTRPSRASTIAVPPFWPCNQCRSASSACADTRSVLFSTSRSAARSCRATVSASKGSAAACGSRRRRPAPPRLQAAASDRPARPARCARVGHAAGFDHDPFRQRIQRQHPRQRLVEAAGQRAADAAIGQPQHLPGAVRQQARVHVHRPEVVHQHRRAPPVLRQRMVQQRGLAAPRKPPTTVSGMRPPLRRPSQASEAIGRPPTTVPDTRASFRRSAGSRGIILQHAEVRMLADLDGADQMIHVQRQAAPSVMARSASSTPMRSDSPSTRPEDAAWPRTRR